MHNKTQPIAEQFITPIKPGLASLQPQSSFKSTRKHRAWKIPIIGALLIMLGYLCASSFGLNGESEEQALLWINTIGPVALISIMGMTIYRSVTKTPLALWTPYILFLANSALIFGLGPLVYHWGNNITQASLQVGPLALTSEDLLRTNLLNIAGIISTILGYYTISSWHLVKSLARKFTVPGRRNPGTARLAVLFLLAGGFLKYFVLLPYFFGMSDFIVPGVIGSLGGLFDLGLALLAYLATKGDRRAKLLFWVIFPLHLSAILLEFAKTPLMIAIILPTLASFLAHRKIKLLIALGLFAIVVFNMAQPLVHYGRGRIISQTGNHYRATLSERLEITKDYFFSGHYRSEPEGQSKQGGWTRICYAGSQAFAMRAYDSGLPGRTLENLWIVFIPRLIWPSKPVGIGPGKDFDKIVKPRGGGNSFLGLTVYGDGYWNYGWPGVFTLSFIMGGIIAIMSSLTIVWIRSRQFVFLPAILISMQLAMDGPTKFFINGVLGALPIYIFYILAIIALTKVRW